MEAEIKVTFELLGGAKQVMYLKRKQKSYIESIANDLMALSYKIESITSDAELLKFALFQAYHFKYYQK